MDVGDWWRGARRVKKVVGHVRTAVDGAREQAHERRSLWERADSSETPPEELARLADHGDDFVRARVAHNPHTPADVLRRLAFETDSDLARRGAEPMPIVRVGAAGNPSLPADIGAALADDENPWVRAGIASNPAAGPEALAHLAHDDDERVRVAVAGNPNTPVALLVELAQDIDYDVWTARAVAENPSCPEDLARRLRSAIPEPEVEPESPARSHGAGGVAKAGFGVILVHQMAKIEERRHPDDPAIAVLGPLSGALKRAAMDFASEGRDDNDAVAELIRKAGGHDDALRRAALWLRCDGQATEQVVENLAHRLLQAAMSEGVVPEITESERRRMAALEVLRERPAPEAFAVLVEKEPRLGTLADGIRPSLDPPPEDDMSVTPVRSWVAISPGSGAQAMSRIPVVGTRIPSSLLQLIEELQELVGPPSGSPDPILRSHLALNLSLQHCAQLLFPTQ